MKKIFSLFAAVLFAGAMMAESYTITFKSTEGADATASLTSTNVADYIASGAEYVSAISASGKVYNGQAGYGLKFGNSSSAGAITMTLATPVAPTSIVMNASPWSATEGTGLLQDATYDTKSTGAKGTFADFAYEYDGATQVTTIIVGTSSKRGYVKSVTVNYEDGSTPVEVFNYYLVGSMNDWTPASAYKFAANPGAEGEYMLEVTFAAGDEFKVVYSNGTTIADEAWFPQGENNNYVVNEAGDYTVYFRPEYQEAWGNYYTAIKKVYPLYDVADAIAAGLAKGTEIEVRGVVSKMQIKGKNFASYGSVCIYVSDANGAEGEVEFYNCYSLSGAKFSATTPEYDATSTQWADLTEVEDINGLAIHVGDTVIAHGKYELYNSTHELQQNCYLIYAMVPGAEFPTDINNAAAEQKAVKVIRNGQLFIEKNGVLYNAQGSVVK